MYQRSLLLCPWTSSFGYRSVCQYGLMKEGCMTNQKTKECRSAQIETRGNNKQKEKNTPEKQEIQECEYIDT